MTTPMIIRVAYFESLPDRAQSPDHDQFRTWLSQQPGFIRAYHTKK